MASKRKVGKPDKFVDEIPEEVWCRYCNGVYKDPRLLPCLHTLCKKCVDDLNDSKNGKLICPVCSTEVGSEVDTLLPNLLARKRVVELEREKFASRREPCGGCEKHPVTARHKCTECEEFLCDECIQAHKRVKFTKDHEILSLYELTEREKKISKETSSVYCPIHLNEVLDKFCATCDVTICKQCQNYIHSIEANHTHSSIKDVFDLTRSELEEMLRQTRDRIADFQRNVYEIIKSYGRVQNKADDVTWQIRKTSRHLIQAIKDKEHKLLKELHAAQEKRCEALIEEKEKMERKLLQTIDGCDFADDMLRHGKQTEVMMIKKVVNNRLDYLLHLDANVESEKMKMSFQAEEEPVVRAIDEAFGRLHIEYAPPASKDITSPPANTSDQHNITNTGSENQDNTSGNMAGAGSEPVLNSTEEQPENPESNERRSSLPPVVGIKGAKAVTKATAATTFNITTVDHKNNQQEVQVKLETPDDSVLGAHVLDNKDGTYTVFYCPKTTGQHSVYISLSNKYIKHGSRILNIFGSFKGMRSDELTLACKVLCLIRWQLTPGMLQMKNNKIIANPKISFKDLEDPSRAEQRESRA